MNAAQQIAAEGAAQRIPPEGTRQPISADLIGEGQRLVHSLAAKIHRGLPSRFELDDLVGYGQIGLTEAARDFDAAQGSKFTTFAFYRVRGAIYDGLSKMSWTSRARYNRLRYEQMANLALSEEGVGSEAAASLLDDVRWLRSATEKLTVVFLAFLQDDGQGEGDGESQIPDPEAPPAATAAAREINEKLHALIAALPEEERLLIRATYFEGDTLQEAANKLGISKSWASRLHAKTLETLARSLRRYGMD
ncbi:MAG: sigma-70 family RNA polymerase sigma factor [Planctomycetales bacterium]|nr:sigma-70 family RNA polymerase sigma factor [Planctomycetales bacterium]